MKKIGGKLPTSVKAGVWRELAGFDPLEKDTFHYDDTVKRIALVYGVDVETVEKELELSEVLPVFVDCVSFVNGQVIAKLNKVAKKKEV